MVTISLEHGSQVRTYRHKSVFSDLKLRSHLADFSFFVAEIYALSFFSILAQFELYFTPISSCFSALFKYFQVFFSTKGLLWPDLVISLISFLPFDQWQHQKMFGGNSEGAKSKNVHTVADVCLFFPSDGGEEASGVQSLQLEGAKAPMPPLMPLLPSSIYRVQVTWWKGFSKCKHNNLVVVEILPFGISKNQGILSFEAYIYQFQCVLIELNDSKFSLV